MGWDGDPVLNTQTGVTGLHDIAFWLENLMTPPGGPGNTDFYTYNLNDPTTPSFLDSTTISELEDSRGIDIDEGQALAALACYGQGTADPGLGIINLDEPANPTLLGTSKDATRYDGLHDVHWISERCVIGLCRLSNSIVIWDVSDPTNPTETAYLTDSRINYIHDGDTYNSLFWATGGEGGATVNQFIVAVDYGGISRMF